LNAKVRKHWAAWVLAAMVLVSGCSGVLMEQKDSRGQVQRVKIDGGEGWESYDARPRYPYSKTRSNDEMIIMLKSLKTF